VSFNYVLDPEELASEDRWIDVDVTNQILTAYEGSTPVKTFLVSTGTAYHPTVTGLFRIWLRLRWDDMAGPGYYLPSVPYTMYFYEGYALHGTYWHSNFGTPMSHGCVNLHTDDAGWLFEFASVGTLVNVHPAERIEKPIPVTELENRIIKPD
jgi:lipoprotein-anchoring transpeptidase ErfK/SrfK